MLEIKIPLSVPQAKRLEYRRNYEQATNKTGNLLLIAGDQKIEHLNADFSGPGISPEDSSPEHLFKIAAASNGGLLATHLGLIARYGQNYKQLPYLVKINGKTNLGPNDDKDSSKPWWKVEDIIDFKKQSGLKIVGIGYTLYLGGKYEAKMLARVARAIWQAHQAGMIAILWVYPRGKNVDEEDIKTIAGGAGVAACLDADFVKVKYPYDKSDKQKTALKFLEVTKAAGRTKVICVGGDKRPLQDLLASVERQINISQTCGLAIGRNLHQRSLSEATKLTTALEKIIFKAPKINKKTTKFLGLF